MKWNKVWISVVRWSNHGILVSNSTNFLLHFQMIKLLSFSGTGEEDYGESGDTELRSWVIEDELRVQQSLLFIADDWDVLVEKQSGFVFDLVFGKRAHLLSWVKSLVDLHFKHLLNLSWIEIHSLDCCNMNIFDSDIGRQLKLRLKFLNLSYQLSVLILECKSLLLKLILHRLKLNSLAFFIRSLLLQFLNLLDKRFCLLSFDLEFASLLSAGGKLLF